MLLLKRYILFSFLILTHNLSECTLAARTDVQYCGFEQRCERNQTNNVATKYSCCQPCECVDICKERDTCCADMEKLNDTEEIIKQQCLPAEFVPHSLMDSGNYISYYVRSRCPKTFTDNVVKEHCEKQTNETLEEITFVSSKDEDIIYRNKFCGLCHGDKTTKPWSLLVSQECLQVLAKADVTLNSVNKVILANCKISLIEPSGLNIKQSICFDDNLIITRCNLTGEWDVYNKTLEELCLNPPEAVNYYFYERIFPSVFRSVFCYLCNRKYGISVQEKCESFERSPGALSGLIRQSSLTGSQDEQKTSATCNNDEILDPTFNICRRLYCQTFFLPDIGQCKPFLDTQFRYQLFLKLVFLQPTLKSDLLKQDLSSLSVLVANKLGFSKCDICYLSILRKRDINETMLYELNLDVALAPKKKCEIEYLFSKLTGLEMTSSNISIVLNETIILFEVLWDNRLLFRTSQYEKIYTNYIKPCGTKMPAEYLSTCAKVKLGIHEYKSVLKNHVNANQLLFAPVKGDMNGTMFVCIDKYIVNPHSAGDKAKSSFIVAFATLIIISYRSTF